MTEMFKHAGTAIRALWPPRDGEDPRPWRWAVFWAIIVLAFVMATHLLASKGALEPYVTAVARADEVRSVQRTQVAILYAIYSPQIRAKVRQRCDTSDASDRERINQELDRLLKEYEDAAGVRFEPMPTCGQV